MSTVRIVFGSALTLVPFVLAVMLAPFMGAVATELPEDLLIVNLIQLPPVML